MGGDLFESRPDLLGERADQILGWSLRRVCLDGPEEELTRTERAQPALYALSYALWATLHQQWGRDPAAAAGHSLGEYTALTAAGSLDFDAGLALVALRGRAMAAAADLEPSGMAAIIGATPELGEEVAAARRGQGGRLQVANLNAPGQVVLAGGAEDIEWLTDHGPEHGVRRVIPLKVAGGFHSSFMEGAAGELGAALDSMSLKPPRFPVWSNTTARPHRAEEIGPTLVRQVVSPVRFSESLAGMAESGIDTFVHVGPGDVTAGMARKSVPEATVLTVSAIDDVPPVLDVLGTM
jgi:[acyl-carrier-protein] S-malonyltransferase